MDAVTAFRDQAARRPGSRKAALTPAEERRLVREARSGDARAMRRLLEGISDSIYRFSKGFCRNETDAEDVMQGVLTAVVRNLDTFRGESSLTTWAYTVARNACTRFRRRAASAPDRFESLDAPGSEESGPLQVADPGEDPAERVERGELRAMLEQAIAALPAPQREVLLLRDVEGMPARDVGHVLGLGERAVKSRLHRGRIALRRALAPYLAGEAMPGRRGQAAKPARRGRRAAGAGDPTRVVTRTAGPAGAPPAGAHCPDTARMLSRYLEGELDSNVCARLESHVATCANCGDACRTLLSALGACRAWGAKPLPPGERAQVRRAIRAVLDAEAR
ncbi:MAG: sigma-70 family RNA polymerase sigma factor [Candidatus Eisenbacteria bacterium]|nr:sigma-70 family RNA polymerase sigma factor [Candidatus Eisenbacteria bacterium]